MSCIAFAAAAAAARRGVLRAACAIGWVVGATCAATAHASPPAEVREALRSVGVPDSALAFVVADVATGRTLLEWQPEQPMNPASLAKLVTTQAALERLGPAWTWATPVWLQGSIRDGVLDGDLHLQGNGDPKLVHERLWLLLRRVMQLGVREIRGDIVLDNSAFAIPDGSPGEFDGEALRPYNVRPAALLLNYRAIAFSFTPDAGAGVARVGVEPALARLEADRVVPLSSGPCNDWRGALDARFGPGDNGSSGEWRVRFAGRYPLACGELAWSIADPQPGTYDQRLLEGLWREMGGTLTGRVREGPPPTELKPTFEHRSPPLAEVVRDINKFSNNVMAEQVALTLAREVPLGAANAIAATAAARPATPQAARAWLQRWLAERLGAGAAAGAVLSNGSGLSRDSRLSARQLARLLVLAAASPTMPELMASLPVTASDGTTRRMRVAPGRAHLKTGSLRDSYGVAGYVLAANGRRLVVAALVNHAHANAARPALESLVQWAHAEAAASASSFPPARTP